MQPLKIKRYLERNACRHAPSNNVETCINGKSCKQKLQRNVIVIGPSRGSYIQSDELPQVTSLNG